MVMCPQALIEIVFRITLACCGLVSICYVYLLKRVPSSAGTGCHNHPSYCHCMIITKSSNRIGTSVDLDAMSSVNRNVNTCWKNTSSSHRENRLFPWTQILLKFSISMASSSLGREWRGQKRSHCVDRKE